MATKKEKFIRFVAIVFLAALVGSVVERIGGPGFGIAVLTVAGIYEWLIVEN